MLKNLLFVLLFFTSFGSSAVAQKIKNNPTLTSGFHRCGTQTLLDEEIKRNPARKLQIEENRKKTLAAFEQLKHTLRPDAIYTIPVVVHIVLTDPLSVTNAQVQSQLDVLNEDYAGLNADSTRIPAAFKPLFGKGNIRFCLARRDTKGDASNGIVRVTSTTISSPGDKDPVKFSCAGGSDAWDPTKYLNIWVCNMPSGFLGYSFFASDPLSEKPLNERGFVNNFRSFGKGGTAQAPFNLGRTATHEIGHFFDLNHIWGPNNCDGTQSCDDEDGVNDTPKQFKCTFGAPAADSVIKDACQLTNPGIMWMNYMDYVDDRAMVMYTPQQNARMEAILLSSPWLSGLLTSDGCTPVPSLNRDVRFEKFREPFYDLCGSSNNLIFSCDANYKPIITVRNTGTDNITSLTITAKLGTWANVVTNWTGNLAPQSTINITLNTITLSPGVNNNLVVYTSNPNGSADQKTSNDTGKLAGIVYPIIAAPYSEGFESNSFPPANWQRLNPNADTTWLRTTTAAKTGNASMFIDNFHYNSNGASDWMFSPLIPVKGKDSAFITFNVAAATFNKPDLANNPTDTLEVLVTTDCGLTYKSVYKKWGKDLVTTGNVGVDTGFIPRNDQWRKDTVFLGDFSNATFDYAQAVIRNITNYENNIYIDDINITTKTVSPILKRKGIMATPNPFRDKVYLQHYPGPINIEYVNVYDFAGRLVWQKKISLNLPGTNRGPDFLELNLNHLSSGIYTIQVVYRVSETQTIRVLKIN
jgi:Pregnancy-associated plasma protein-A